MFPFCSHVPRQAMAIGMSQQQMFKTEITDVINDVSTEQKSSVLAFNYNIDLHELQSPVYIFIKA